MSPGGARSHASAWAGVLLLPLLGACSPEGRPLTLPALAAGNWEFDPRPDGSVVPVFFGPTSDSRLCLAVDATTDTALWEARIFTGEREPADGPAAEPWARLADTVCFRRADLRWDAPEGADTPLCLLVRQRATGRVVARSCVVARWRREPPEHGALWRQANEIAEGETGHSVGLSLARLDELAGTAEAAGLAALPVRIRLRAVALAREKGGERRLLEVMRRLVGLPPWLARREASELAGKRAFELAELELEYHGPTAVVWRQLAAAERGYARVAHPSRIQFLTRQAELLFQVGASLEARRRLEQALAECETARCDERKVAEARVAWGWYTMEAPEATAEDLAAARREQQEILAGAGPSLDPLRLANLWINLAYVQIRLGESAEPALVEARAVLARLDTSAGFARLLSGWERLLGGLEARARGDAATARARCAELVGWRVDGDPSVAVEALSCLARASRELGDLEEAGRRYEELLRLHESRSPLALSQGIAVSSVRRAADYYQAVRVEVERGRAREGWRILDRLDELAVREEALRACRARQAPVDLAELERSWERLAEQQRELSRPSAGRAREERLRRQAELSRWQQEAARSLASCDRVAAAASPAQPDLRALALEDEVLLLARDRDSGRVWLARRTPMRRGDLQARLRAVAEALAERRLGGDGWRRLVEPLASAVAPEPRAAGVVSFGLYGSLQGVPLAALPDGGGWLIDRVVPVIVPAAAGVAGAAVPGPDAGELFVVDPRGDLAGGSVMATELTRLRPRARLLARAAATREAVRALLPAVAVFHVDAHARFDDAFPELSRLDLADGPLQLPDLAALPAPPSLVNLSACRSGAWPITADSGRFGLAGHFARRGSAWVMASRSALDDAVARDLNLAFYRAWGRDARVPEAFAAALRQIRPRHPPAAWAGMLLLSGAAAGNGGRLLLPPHSEVLVKPLTGHGPMGKDAPSERGDRP